MDFWMHGLGGDPDQNAKKLKKSGFSAVIGDSSAIDAARGVGLDCYLCTGAYGYGAFNNEGYLSLDVNGDRRLWFGSACPTNAEVRSKNISDIKTMAASKNIKGVLIDGARFASPASADNAEAFFTCFCGNCMEKATGYGYDAARMQKSAFELYRLYKGDGNSSAFVERHLAGLMDWFAFRRIATTEHLLNFVDAVKSANADMIAGIYIFTPSLSFLVGQNYSDLAKRMDIISPMIYRKYKSDDGPACLNHETTAIFNILRGVLKDAKKTRALLSALTGVNVDEHIKETGFPPETVGAEVKKAAGLAGGEKIIPIILLDDDRLRESIKSCADAGARTVSFFTYDDALIGAAAEEGLFKI